MAKTDGFGRQRSADPKGENLRAKLHPSSEVLFCAAGAAVFAAVLVGVLVTEAHEGSKARRSLRVLPHRVVENEHTAVILQQNSAKVDVSFYSTELA